MSGIVILPTTVSLFFLSERLRIIEGQDDDDDGECNGRAG